MLWLVIFHRPLSSTNYVKKQTKYMKKKTQNTKKLNNSSIRPKSIIETKKDLSL